MDILGSGWKSISTAPRNLDGYLLLVSDGKYVVPGRWDAELGWYLPDGDGAVDSPPTHWISVEDLMRALPFPAASLSSQQPQSFSRDRLAAFEPGQRTRLTLRIRREIKEFLNIAANENGRSTSAEAEVRLQHSFFEDNIFRSGI